MNLHGMIASVGGAPDPVRKALGERRPSYVLFVVSSASKSQVEEKILPGLDYVPQYGYSEISDHQDIGICYQEIRTDIARWLGERGLCPDEVYVDITGGTKAMSAALMLATVERFKNFTYIGGYSRDANDLGTVIPGSEHVIRRPNPWITYAVRELERGSELLKDFYAGPAAEILENASQKCGDSQRARLESFAGLARALELADRFDFKGGQHQFKRYRSKLELALDYQLYQRLIALHEHWEAVGNQVRRSDQTAGQETLLELLANAQRRAKQARYDDAVGRLYRAVELYGQQLVQQAFGANLGKISIEDLPTDAREEIIEELGQPSDEPYKLGVQNIFWILKFSEDDTLRKKSQIYDEIENHLQRRNNSLLAHGLQPVKEEIYTSFWGETLLALNIDDSEIPRWPEIIFKLPHK